MLNPDLSNASPDQTLNNVQATPNATEQALQLMDQARQNEIKGSYEDLVLAFTLYTKATEVDPQNAAAWIALGDCYSYSTDPNPDRQPRPMPFVDRKKALECYNKATEVAPNNPDVWISLGDYYRVIMKPDGWCSITPTEKADEYYKKAIELAPNNAAVWISIGGRMSEPDKQVKCYTKATELAPDSADAWIELGRWYNRNFIDYSKREEALKCFEKATQVNPNDGRAWMCLGLCYQDGPSIADSNYSKAKEYIKKATKLSPENPAYWCELSDHYRKYHGKRFKSLESYQKAVDLEPEYNSPMHRALRAITETKCLEQTPIEHRTFFEKLDYYQSIKGDEQRLEEFKEKVYGSSYAYYKERKMKRKLDKAEQEAKRADNSDNLSDDSIQQSLSKKPNNKP